MPTRAMDLCLEQCNTNQQPRYQNHRFKWQAHGPTPSASPSMTKSYSLHTVSPEEQPLTLVNHLPHNVHNNNHEGEGIDLVSSSSHMQLAQTPTSTNAQFWANGTPSGRSERGCYARRTYRSVAFGTWKVGGARAQLTTCSSDYALAQNDQKLKLPDTHRIDIEMAHKTGDDNIGLPLTTDNMINPKHYCTLPKSHPSTSSTGSYSDRDNGKFASYFNQAMSWRYRDPSTSGDSAIDTLASGSSCDPSPNQQHVMGVFNHDPQLHLHQIMVTEQADQQEQMCLGGPTLQELAERNKPTPVSSSSNTATPTNSSSSTTAHESESETISKTSSEQQQIQSVLDNFRELRSFVTLSRPNQNKVNSKSPGMKIKSHLSENGTGPRPLGHQRSQSAGNAHIFNVKWPTLSIANNSNGGVHLPVDPKHNPDAPAKPAQQSPPNGQGNTGPLAATRNFFRRKLSRSSGKGSIDAISMPNTPFNQKRNLKVLENGGGHCQMPVNHGNNFVLRPRMAEAEDVDSLLSCSEELPRVFMDALRDPLKEAPVPTLTVPNTDGTKTFATWDDAMRQLSADLHELRQNDVQILREFQRLELALKGVRSGNSSPASSVMEDMTPDTGSNWDHRYDNGVPL